MMVNESRFFSIFPTPDAQAVSAPRAGLPGLEGPNTPYPHFLTGARCSLAENEPVTSPVHTSSPWLLPTSPWPCPSQTNFTCASSNPGRNAPLSGLPVHLHAEDPGDLGIAGPELRMEWMWTRSFACLFQEQSVGRCFPLSLRIR